MTKAVVALSGGIDSATTMVWLLRNGYDVIPVRFIYGSKHNQYELRAAWRIANYFGFTPIDIDLTQVMSNFQSNLLQGGGDIPEGHYTDSTMSQTVVPARNIIFLSILAGLAGSYSASTIALGIHQGDHAIYADCRTEFYKAMDTAIFLGTDKQVQIKAPFVEHDKTAIIEWGLEYGVPYGLTRTCYKDHEVACGKCGACVERLLAFNELGVVDPIIYEEKDHEV